MYLTDPPADPVLQSSGRRTPPTERFSLSVTFLAGHRPQARWRTIWGPPRTAVAAGVTGEINFRPSCHLSTRGWTVHNVDGAERHEARGIKTRDDCLFPKL